MVSGFGTLSDTERGTAMTFMSPSSSSDAMVGVMVVTVLRYGVALLIVLGGVTWAGIWLLSGRKVSGRQPGGTKLRELPIWAVSIWLLTAVYAAVYYGVALIVGGTPPKHFPQDGKYWLTWSGHSTEVSRATYLWSQAGEMLLILLIAVSVYALCKLPKSKPPSGARS